MDHSERNKIITDAEQNLKEAQPYLDKIAILKQIKENKITTG